MLYQFPGYNPCIDEDEKKELVNGSFVGPVPLNAGMTNIGTCLPEQETRGVPRQKLYPDTYERLWPLLMKKLTWSVRLFVKY